MLDPTATNFNDLAIPLAFFGGLTILFVLLPKEAYYNGEEAYINNPKNYYIIASFTDGYWYNGTWIPNDYYLRTKGKKYSFKNGEVTHFDYRTGCWHTFDGNYGETVAGKEEIDSIEYDIEDLKNRWGFPFEIIGTPKEYQTQKVKKSSWFSGWYED